MISSFSCNLADALGQGRFEPAPVQREYQWTTKQSGDLLDDVFGAFVRLGLDPDWDAEDVGAAAADVDADLNDDLGDKIPNTDPIDLPDDEAADLDAALALEVDDTPLETGRIRAARVTGRGRRRPPEIYNLQGIVLLRAPRAPDLFYVYDGLQRLVTLTILIAKLRHGAEAPTVALASQADQLLFVATNSETPSRRVLVPTSGASLATIVSDQSFRRGQLTLGDSRMREVARYFNARLSAWSDARRAAFVAFLAERVVLSVQLLEDSSLAFQTFVTANDRGLRLEIGDIIKGELIERANQLRATAEEVEEIASGWRRQQGQMRAGFKEFLPAVETLKFGFDDGYAPGERLITLFDDASGATSIADWIETEFSELAELFQRSRQHFKLKHTSKTDLRFRQLSLLGWKEWQPIFLALSLTHGGTINERRFSQQISSLYRVCYTMELIGWKRERRRRFKLALEQIADGHNPFQAKIRGGDAGALYLTQFWRDIARRKLQRPFVDYEQRGTIVRWLETLHWGQSLPRECTDDCSVEHVLPVTTTGDWSRQFKDAEHDAWVNRLGNLCLLPKDVNEAQANKSWRHKVDAYEQKRGEFRTVDGVLQAARKGWTVDAIRSRTLKLAYRASRALRLDPAQQKS